jgi:hypothetical protein
MELELPAVAVRRRRHGPRSNRASYAQSLHVGRRPIVLKVLDRLHVGNVPVIMLVFLIGYVPIALEIIHSLHPRSRLLPLVTEPTSSASAAAPTSF